MTRLPVKPGIDGLPTSQIPTDPSDFIDWFKNSFIPRWAANADIRNATPGTGVQISGTSDTPGFVGFEAIAGTSVLGNASGATGDVQAITAGADGEALQRIAGSLVFAPISIATADSITGDGTSGSPIELVHDSAAPGVSQYYGTDVGGLKGFFALPSAGGSTITTLTQAGGTSQTYTVPPTAHALYVICIGGGGGGGTGLRVTASTSGGGGSGGGGGSISVATLRTADVGSSVTVTFSSTTGGAGGAASPATGSGNNGVNGSDVTFGNFCAAAGGNHGNAGAQGGTTGGASAQILKANFAYGTAAPNNSTSAIGVAGSNPSGAAGVGNTNVASLYCACAGGAGGGINTVSNTAFAGGAGGGTTQAGGYPTQVPGGAGGAIATNGSPGTNGSGTQGGAGGGGGGGAVGAALPGNGANGGNFGGGGGGGGCCTLTPTVSGAGGNGGPAACIVIAW